MPLITKQQKEFYRENGYLVIPQNVPKKEMERVQEAALRVEQKCISGLYPYCRADKRFSDDFIEKIEHVFHPDIFESDLFRAVVNSKIIDHAKELLGYDDVFLSFQRMHVTSGYSCWSSWHRDDITDGRDFTIKATFPLFPECGFFVVPGSHKKGNDLIPPDTQFKGALPGEVRVPVKPGDLLLFHTSIAHRGTCAGRKKYRRAHLHFRVTATQYADEHARTEDPWSNRPEILALADKTWRELLTKNIDTDGFYKTTMRGEPTSGVGGMAGQLMRRAFYYGTALLPAEHRWMSEPPFGWVPYVRVPEKYRELYD